jgi:choline dehydrogenase
MSSDTEFDVVVVGAGAGGCSLAYRLTEVTGVRVLLLEAGPDERPESIAVPARWLEAMGGPYDYGYATTPQTAAAGRVIPTPRGRVLGGSTAINAMIHARPGPADLDLWGPGWSYDDCAEALAAMESHRGGGPTRGTVGPAVNGLPREPNQINLDFLRGALEAGYPLAEDINAPGASGAARFDLAIDEEGMRADAAQSYLRKAAPRDNLTVWTNTRATHLTMSGDRVSAVTLIRDGAEQTLPVTGQLVLSAGVIDTPALLLRSGIGPADELRSIGVDPVLDLPGVGRNLHDHPAIPVIWASEKQIDPPRNQFAETVLLLPHTPEANGQTISVAFHHIAALPPDANPPANGATALVGLYEVHSRGSLRLNPADPAGPPLIDPGYFTDGRDAAALAAAIEIARNVGRQPSLKPYELVEIVPGPHVQGQEALEGFVRNASISYAHPVGTCAMGTSADSVVDHELAVRGVSNLRIADASAIPTIPGVAPSVAIQLIGWRAAELILEHLMALTDGASNR